MEEIKFLEAQCLKEKINTVEKKLQEVENLKSWFQEERTSVKLESVILNFEKKQHNSPKEITETEKQRSIDFSASYMNLLRLVSVSTFHHITKSLEEEKKALEESFEKL